MKKLAEKFLLIGLAFLVLFIPIRPTLAAEDNAYTEHEINMMKRFPYLKETYDSMPGRKLVSQSETYLKVEKLEDGTTKATAYDFDGYIKESVNRINDARTSSISTYSRILSQTEESWIRIELEGYTFLYNGKTVINGLTHFQWLKDPAFSLKDLVSISWDQSVFNLMGYPFQVNCSYIYDVYDIANRFQSTSTGKTSVDVQPGGAVGIIDLHGKSGYNTTYYHTNHRGSISVILEFKESYYTSGQLFGDYAHKQASLVASPPKYYIKPGGGLTIDASLSFTYDKTKTIYGTIYR